MLEIKETTDMFRLEILQKEVNVWNEGSEVVGGDYLRTTDVNMCKDFISDKITLKKIIEEINELLCVKVTHENFEFENEALGSFDIYENGDGIQDENGKYLAMYTFVVTPIVESLDLEEMFKKDLTRN